MTTTDSPHLEPKMNHVNQVIVFAALPTIGQCQSVFDDDEDLDMETVCAWRDSPENLLLDFSESSDSVSLMTDLSEDSSCSSVSDFCDCPACTIRNDLDTIQDFFDDIMAEVVHSVKTFFLQSWSWFRASFVIIGHKLKRQEGVKLDTIAL